MGLPTMLSLCLVVLCCIHVGEAWHRNYTAHRNHTTPEHHRGPIEVRFAKFHTTRSYDGEGRIESARGLVEVRRPHGSWGTVCDDHFDSRDATVLCRQMGFQHGVYPGRGYSVGNSATNIWLDDVRCTGRERDISQCSYRGWGIHNCGHSEDVTIKCRNDRRRPYPTAYPTTEPPYPGPEPDRNHTIAVRMKYTARSYERGRISSARGLVQVRRPHGSWGTVCDDHFDSRAATVLCRQMGFLHGRHIGWRYRNRIHLRPYERNTTKIWLDDVRCTGRERAISQCSYRGWGDHNCGHSEDVTIACDNDRRRRPYTTPGWRPRPYPTTKPETSRPGPGPGRYVTRWEMYRLVHKLRNAARTIYQAINRGIREAARSFYF